MTERRFVLVILDVRGTPNSKKIKAVLDRAADWIQFMPNSWLLWTKGTPGKWYGRFKPIMQTGDNILVCEANLSERAGLMPKTFWDFVKSKS